MSFHYCHLGYLFLSNQYWFYWWELHILYLLKFHMLIYLIVTITELCKLISKFCLFFVLSKLFMHILNAFLYSYIQLINTTSYNVVGTHCYFHDSRADTWTSRWESDIKELLFSFLVMIVIRIIMLTLIQCLSIKMSSWVDGALGFSLATSGITREAWNGCVATVK